MRFIKRKFGVSIDWESSAKIVFSSTVAGALTYAAILLLPFNSPIKLVIGLIIFVVAFVIIAVITRTLTKSDLGNIREIGNSLGPLRKPLIFVLNLIEKFMDIVQK